MKPVAPVRNTDAGLFRSCSAGRNCRSSARSVSARKSGRPCPFPASTSLREANVIPSSSAVVTGRRVPYRSFIALTNRSATKLSASMDRSGRFKTSSTSRMFRTLLARPNSTLDAASATASPEEADATRAYASEICDWYLASSCGRRGFRVPVTRPELGVHGLVSITTSQGRSNGRRSSTPARAASTRRSSSEPGASVDSCNTAFASTTTTATGKL
mmetsp:Transcript_77371/g.226918  ORF Transcript_77371/g.226918 Transcript_77371/m.226918 type:complete len:216 (-) Transcript_77371:3-650(-)